MARPRKFELEEREEAELDYEKEIAEQEAELIKGMKLEDITICYTYVKNGCNGRKTARDLGYKANRDIIDAIKPAPMQAFISFLQEKRKRHMCKQYGVSFERNVCDIISIIERSRSRPDVQLKGFAELNKMLGYYAAEKLIQTHDFKAFDEALEIAKREVKVKEYWHS